MRRPPRLRDHRDRAPARRGLGRVQGPLPGRHASLRLARGALRPPRAAHRPPGRRGAFDLLRPGRRGAREARGELPAGRHAWIEFFELRQGKASIPCTRLAVAADPRLSLTAYRETPLLTPLAKWLGLTHDVDSGDARFDDKFVVSTPREDGARRAYAHGLKEAIETAFERYSVDSFEIAEGRLKVTFKRPAVEPEAYPVLLGILDTAAASFDRVPIVVHALGGSTRRALARPGGKTRCAYCHGDVTGSEPDLVACDRCHTVLHGGCWDELGHCPLLGCSGRSPERAPIR